MNHHTNTVRIKAVANALGALNNKVVFVGGSTLSLYASRRTFEVRPTDDVDIIVEILNYAQRGKLEETLRDIGFINDVASGVICRWQIEKITVDIMPTDDESIGFSNQWYPDGFKNAITYTIDEKCTINILSAPYFLATKFEAFKSRGRNDGLSSHDFEDIIYVLENRKEVWREIQAAPINVKKYLLAEFRRLLNNPSIIEWIEGSVERASPPSTYQIYDQLKDCVK